MFSIFVKILEFCYSSSGRCDLFVFVVVDEILPDLLAFLKYHVAFQYTRVWSSSGRVATGKRSIEAML